MFVHDASELLPNTTEVHRDHRGQLSRPQRFIETTEASYRDHRGQLSRPQRPVIETDNATISNNISVWGKINSDKLSGNCFITN